MPRASSRAHRNARQKLISDRIEYLADPAGEERRARIRVKKAEEAVETDLSRRKWFGGGKDHAGSLGLGRKDADLRENRDRLDSARERLNEVKEYRTRKE